MTDLARAKRLRERIEALERKHKLSVFEQGELAAARSELQALAQRADKKHWNAETERVLDVLGSSLDN